MNKKWPPGSPNESDSQQLDLDSEVDADLDEALQQAVEAVEAAEAAGQPRDEDEAEVGEETETLEIDEMSVLRAELEELRQRSTRTLADFDNYRKRVERERETQMRFGGIEVLRGLLDIIDNLERALASDGPIEDLKSGVKLTLRQAEGLLKQHGVSRIEADGVVFDPSLHEAVSRIEQEGISEPKVTAVLQSGYQMHERLLRPVRVAVAVPVVAESAPRANDDGEEG